ncbi:MAG: lipid-A-disaccharide synthase [Candidatus Omnitrophica bacterium]|nr:lipid-A-disaccharide synthase [Candidatus Omnitrophota bacterium]
MEKHIIIVAGEPSADMHAASLVLKLKQSCPDLRISGIGSTQMREAGVEILIDLAQYAIIGFIEVLKHYNIFKAAFNRILKEIAAKKPHAVILIDYPGFNLRLAKRIKKDFPEVKIIYYISPQIWAWGKKRIHMIKQVVDKMLVIFEFEQTLYRENNIDAEFVGHPLIEHIHLKKGRKELLEQIGLFEQDLLISLLPGSREIEVKRILPVMLESAKLLYKKMPQAKFIILKASNIKNELIKNLIRQYLDLPLTVIENDTYEYLHISSFAWVCSGTATLETAIINTPMLIVYKTSLLTWLISRLLIKLPFIGLVNIVAQRKIVPEFIQFQAKKKPITEKTIQILQNKQELLKIKGKLLVVKEKLGNKQASKSAAQIILSFINKT